MKKVNFPTRLKRTTVYKSPWINLFTDRVLLPSGKIIEQHHFLDFPKQSVVVLIENAKQEILFIKSLRYTTQKVGWELPAGGIEKGENIIKAAQREVEEESGFKTKNLKLVYTYNPSNGMSNQVAHVVFGKVTNKPSANFDTNEVKSSQWLSKTEIKKLIKQKKITDGMSLIPLLMYLAS